MTESQELLAAYVRTGSDEAFRELVERYVDLVYSTALRRLNGNAALAEDVTQLVFINLSKSAGKLVNDSALGGWLHRNTCFVVGKVLREESRRTAREKEAVRMESLKNSSEATFNEVAPLIDQVIDELPDDDRSAIVLRYFERCDFRTIGSAIGASEDAARVRVNRALEKLHALLTRRGVNISASALGIILSEKLVVAAPMLLASQLASASAAQGGASAGVGIFMTKLNATIAAVAVVSITCLFVAMNAARKEQIALEEQNQRLQRQLQQLTEQGRELTVQHRRAQASRNSGNAESLELAALRREANSLRDQLTTARTRTDAPAPVEAPSPPLNDEAKLQQLCMSNAKTTCAALIMYAEKHGGQLPQDLSMNELDPYYHTALGWELNPGEKLRDTNELKKALVHFEVVYRGSLEDLGDFAGDVVVLQQRNAIETPSGAWYKVYGFADGHTQIVEMRDGNFETWEKQHIVRE